MIDSYVFFWHVYLLYAIQGFKNLAQLLFGGHKFPIGRYEWDINTEKEKGKPKKKQKMQNKEVEKGFFF